MERKPTDEEMRNMLERAMYTRCPDKILALRMRLKALKTAAFQRNGTWRKVSEEYARECVMCEGSGQAHFCINPTGHAGHELEKDDCAHFTPSELESYNDIHRDYLLLLKDVAEELTKEGSPEAIKRMAKSTDPSEMN